MSSRTPSPPGSALILALLTAAACGGGAPAANEPAGPVPDPGPAPAAEDAPDADGEGARAGAKPERTCEVAPEYRYEYIALPPEFAPELPAGYEELFFAPGMFEPDAAGYFSYVFALVLDDDAPTGEDELEELLDIYYRGLIGAVGESRGESYDLSRVKARVHAAPNEPGEYDAAITIFDAFSDGRELGLRVELQVNGQCIRAAVSPSAPDDPIWGELATAGECLPCS